LVTPFIDGDAKGLKADEVAVDSCLSKGFSVYGRLQSSPRRLGVTFVLASAALVVAPRAARAACVSFIGGDGSGAMRTAWSDPNNWSGGAVPTQTTDVCLDGMATKVPNVDVDATAKSLTVTSAFTSNLTFSNGAALHVFGDASWGGSGTFDAGTNSGNVTIDGSVTVSTGGAWKQNAAITLQIGLDLSVPGGAFTGSSGTLLVGRDVNISGGGTFNASSGSVTITRDLAVSAGTFTGSSGTLLVGRDLLVTGTGTFAGASGLLKVTRNLTLTGTSFKASNTVTRIGGSFTHSAATTYNDNNGNLLFNATTNQSHTFGGATFKRATFNDGMVGYWNLDDNTFNNNAPVDNSGYLNVGASTNVTRTTTSPPSLSFTDTSYATFNGTSSVVSLTVNQLPAASAAQSIAAWINIGAMPAGASTIVALTGASSAVKLGLGASTVQVLNNIGTALISTAAPSTGAWHHVAYTWDGSSNRLYVDGVAATPTATAHDSGAVTGAFLGAGSASAEFYTGSLDEVRVYDRALTAQEVNSLALGRTAGTSIATHTFTDAYLATIGSNVADLVIASGTVSGPGAISIEGSWLNYGGRFTGTGTVTITSAGGESFLSGGSSFAAFTIAGSNGGATHTLRDRMWIPNGPLTISAGKLSTGGFNMHVGSISLAAGTTFTVSTGTVIYDSTSNQTLPAAVLTAYSGLRIEDPSETSLVGYWKLDEGSGTGGSATRDWSGTGNTGTLSATGASWAAAPASMEFDNASAMSFDGAAGYVSTGVSGLPAANASQTISAWVNVTALPASDASIVALNGSSSTVRLALSPTALGVLRNDGTALISTAPPSTGAWHHVAYTWDGSNNQLYVDGTAVSPTTTAHDSAAVSSAFIGATGAAAGFLSGKVDDVRVYSAALSATQVSRLAAGRYAGTGGYATFTLGANTTASGAFGIDAGNLVASTFTFKASLTTSPAVVATGSYAVGSTSSTFSGGLTVRSGGTLQMATSGGSVQIASGQTLTMDGTLAASSAGATIQNAGSGSYTFKVGSTPTARPTLNITGLAVKNTDTNGMWINADTSASTTFTRFDNIAFSSGTGNYHLQIFATGLFLASNGCTFDAGVAATTSFSVKLTGNGYTGTPDTTQTRALFGAATCASNAASCQASKSDDDSNNDGVPSNPGSNGAVVQFIRAAEADTAGAVVGLPTAAFDWNTGAYYSTYVAYNAAAGSNATVYVRNGAGSALYSWTSPGADTMVGSPRFATVGSTHYLYVGMASGKVYQLVDDGTQLTMTGAAWTTNPYDCGCTIVTPLGMDSTNLYWGGTQSGNKLWTLGQASEAQPMGSPFPLTPVVTTASPTVWVNGSTTYAFVGTIGHILEINASNQSLAADNSNPGTASVLGRIVLGSNAVYRIFAGDDGGRMWAIDPANFAGTNKLWSYTVASDAIKSSPYYHYATDTLHFGTEAGKVVVLNNSGAALTGYPYVPGTTSDAIRAGLLYWSGILVVGTQNGKLFFLDRNNGTTGPAPIVQYFFGPTEVVSGIGFDLNTNRYIVAAADPGVNDGRLYYFDVITDPTPGAL
jgi:hypothetical protein